MRLALYGSASTALAASVIVGAFRQRANFYAACVYLSKSNACMMILCNYGIFLSIVSAKLLIALFFGNLRTIELERMHDRLWFTVTETLLALAMFREDFDALFVVLFVSLIVIKCFHWLAADRVEWMDQTADPPSRLFHLRMVTALATLWVTDLLFIIFSVESILIDGPTVILMFCMEYLILLANCWSVASKYGINVYAIRVAQRRPVLDADTEGEGDEDEPDDAGHGGGPDDVAAAGGQWEMKSTYIFYIDLLTDLLKLSTYLLFLSVSLTFFSLTLPINVLRDVYFTLRSFLARCANLSRWRRATRDLQTRYPDAERDEMERLEDKTCIICREDMEHWETRQERRRRAVPTTPPATDAPTEGAAENPTGRGPSSAVRERSRTSDLRRRRRGQPHPRLARSAAPRRANGMTPKKLPCGHIFHFHCLRSWLERQQTCPTCRRPVLDTPAQPPSAAPPAPAPAAAPAARAVPTGAPTGPAPGTSDEVAQTPASGPSQPTSSRQPPRPLQLRPSQQLPPPSWPPPTSTSSGPPQRGLAPSSGPGTPSGTRFGPSPPGSQTAANNPLVAFELPLFKNPHTSRQATSSAASGSLPSVPASLAEASRMSTPEPPGQVPDYSTLFNRPPQPRPRPPFPTRRSSASRDLPVLIPLFDTKTGHVSSAFSRPRAQPLDQPPQRHSDAHRANGVELSFQSAGPPLGEGWSQSAVDAATLATRKNLEGQLALLVDVQKTLAEAAERLSASLGILADERIGSPPLQEAPETPKANRNTQHRESLDEDESREKGKAPAEGLRAIPLQVPETPPSTE